MKLFNNTKVFYSSLATGVSFLLPVAALAQGTDAPRQLAVRIVDILNIVVTIVFIIAVIVFGWGIVKLILAAGDPAAIKQAKGFIVWGVIGIAVLASIFGLINYLRNFFDVGAGGGTIIPPSVDTPGGTVGP